MRTEQSPVPGDGLNGNDPVRRADTRPLSIKDATETAERETAAALKQGVPSYYLVPTGDRYHPWRRIDVGLSG